MPMMDIGHVIVFMFLGGMFMLVRMDSFKSIMIRVQGHYACGCVHGIIPYARASVHVAH